MASNIEEILQYSKRLLRELGIAAPRVLLKILQPNLSQLYYKSSGYFIRAEKVPEQSVSPDRKQHTQNSRACNILSTEYKRH